MTRSLRRLSLALLMAFTIVALAAGYWIILRGPSLLAREDNPRLVLAEQQIVRGQITDRNGTVLAASRQQEDGTIQRIYPNPSAAPVVGYYSIRYGVGGVESQYDALLRGTTSRSQVEQIASDLLHREPQGGNVRLTLSLPVQQAVARSLEGYTGAAVVLSVPSGDVLAMVSSPTYDPNTLNQNWETLTDDPSAPLLNRVTQGLYQPGTILQPVILGAALNTTNIQMDEPISGTLTTAVNSSILPCAGSSMDIDTIREAFLAACPAPFRQVALRTGAHALDNSIADFGLLDPPPLALATEVAELEAPPASQDILQTAVGQSMLTITPLHMARVAASFADGGQMPPLRLIDAIQHSEGLWQVPPASGNPRGTISRANAEQIGGLMAESVSDGAASPAALPGYTVHGHVGLALTGPEDTLSTWFIGFVSAETDVNQSFAVAILLESVPSTDAAARIGGQALQAALSILPSE